MRAVVLSFVLSLAMLCAPLAFAQVPSTATNVSTSASRPLIPRVIKNTVQTLQNKTALLTQKADFLAAQTQFRTQLQAERQTFKANLDKIKDQHKVLIVTDVNDRIASVSAERTETMHEALTTMTTILGAIQTQAETAKNAGKDTTQLDQAISTAQDTIATADASVTAEASKVYPITITSDTTLRQTVGTTVDQFKTDITSVYEQVVAARQAVLEAARLSRLLTTSNTSSATSSAGEMQP